MNRAEREALYNDAWEHWGSAAQMDKLIEEMSELTIAILKARLNNTFYTYALSEEMADVLICLEQLEVRMKAFPYNDCGCTVNEKGYGSGYATTSNIYDAQVEKIKEEKLLRLKETLSKLKAVK